MPSDIPPLQQHLFLLLTDSCAVEATPFERQWRKPLQGCCHTAYCLGDGSAVAPGTSRCSLERAVYDPTKLIILGPRSLSLIINSLTW